MSAQVPVADLARPLGQLARQVEAGDGVRALPEARRLAQALPGSAQAQLLLAACLSQARLLDEADAAFARTLALLPGQPQVLVHHAAHLRGSGRAEAAMAQAQAAIRADAALPDAWVELARSAEAADQPQVAIAAWQRLMQLQPKHLEPVFELAVLHGRQCDHEAQVAVLADAAAGFPGEPRLLAAQAMAMRQAGRPQAALDLLADSGLHGDPLLDDVAAGALADLGRAAEAIAMARDNLHRHPAFGPGCDTLAGLRWEHEGQAQANAVFEQRLQRAADDDPLRLQYVRFLLGSRQPVLALEQIRRIQHGAGPAPVLLALEADALDAAGELAAAAERYARVAPQLALRDALFASNYARHLLRSGQWRRAEAMARQALALDPRHQEALAYLSTAWRLLDDPREFWLCDYQRSIGTVELEPPPGFDSLAEFLQQLVQALDRLHDATHEPPDQSVRGGTQTTGRLFGTHRPAIVQATRTMLLQAVERHLARLPRVEGHPYFSRNTGRVRIGGSWSVRLRSAGHHANHVHNEGWTSSACYVALPPATLADEDGQGALCLGQPAAELGLGLPPRRVIRPRPGMLALFPSYLWHGTVPFHDTQPRLTIAFDMVPRHPITATEPAA